MHLLTMETAVPTLMYLLYLTGFFFVVRGRMRMLILFWQAQRRLKPEKRRTRLPLEKQLRLLLETTAPAFLTPRRYLGLTVLLFMLILAAAAGTLSLPGALAAAAIVCILPLLFLQARLLTLRSRSSLEGEQLVSAMLTTFRISGCNLFETLERLVAAGSEFPCCRKLLFRMLLVLRSTGSQEGIREATDQFAWAVNTNWGRMLAGNMRMAALQGMDVTAGLEDLLVQLRDARMLYEERKRLNGESVRIVLFLIPALYIGSVLLTVRMLSMPIGVFLHNQLQTRTGMVFLLLAGCLFLMNLLLMELVTRQKLDF